MKIAYKTSKLEKQLTVAKEMQKAFGTMAKKVNQRIKEITASANIEVLKTIPAARCHELKGDKKGQFAVDISGNYRIIFEPDQNPIPVRDDNSIDCIKITDIKILGTEDYH
ncbi:type II toxin-antitoxin system RelE/ParE family toxin [Gaoshiqia sp. Z1-71]|uniref:type II toxin-antitoxin system RelE/ParE family toxin n=1 Tax=Gaoshiqia hydrogeniformans TaxID=3290090 RepID=UPI003BF9244C